jgi:hypothetical protein
MVSQLDRLDDYGRDVIEDFLAEETLELQEFLLS